MKSLTQRTLSFGLPLALALALGVATFPEAFAQGNASAAEEAAEKPNGDRQRYEEALALPEEEAELVAEEAPGPEPEPAAQDEAPEAGAAEPEAQDPEPEPEPVADAPSEEKAGEAPAAEPEMSEAELHYRLVMELEEAEAEAVEVEEAQAPVAAEREADGGEVLTETAEVAEVPAGADGAEAAPEPAEVEVVDATPEPVESEAPEATEVAEGTAPAETSAEVPAETPEATPAESQQEAASEPVEVVDVSPEAMEPESRPEAEPESEAVAAAPEAPETPETPEMKPAPAGEGDAEALAAAEAEEESADPAAATEEDGPAFRIDRFEVRYADETAEQPVPVDDLGMTRVSLGLAESGWVPPRNGLDRRVIGLDEVDLAERYEDNRFHASAIRRISSALVNRMNDAGLIGVWVEPETGGLAEEGGVLDLRIHMARADDVRTLASGDRVETEDRVNHPAHDRIRAGSPVIPGGPDREGDHLDKRQIDRYVKWLSRHPGRRVDVAVAPSDGGGVSLDYLVQENKPWTAYFRIANDGTDQTDEWRQTFGFIHNQLTGNDDILNATYTTTSFDEVHAFNGSYERPIQANERWRWRVRGAYSEFDASTLGFAGLDFEGESFRIGGDLEWNFYQNDDYFADLVAGITVHRSEVDNPGLAVEGDGTFVVPSLGIQSERRRRYDNFWSSVKLQANLRDNETDDLNALGRFDPDDRFVMLTYDLGYSFFLDRFLSGEGWREPSTPETSTLAHELAMNVRGQTAFGNRLTPQYQMTVGGMHTVRGYAQSETSGDDVVLASFEYRLHIPRLFPVVEDPGELFGRPFRWSPQNAYGAPDWDMIFRTFVDVGHVNLNDEPVFEDSDTLVGVGFGAGFRLKRNVSVDVDWGFAASDTNQDSTTSGSSQVHISATILY